MVITYPTRRAYLQGPGYGPGWGTPSEYQYYSAENCQTILDCGYDSVIIGTPYAPSTPYWFETRMVNYADYNIPVMIQVMDIEGWGPKYGVPNATWDAADFETNVGPFIDYWEDDDRVCGYAIELPNLVGMQWLRSRTDKVLAELCISDWVIDNAGLQTDYGYYCSASDFYTLTGLFDESILEYYIPGQANAMLRHMDYVHTNFPANKIGSLDATQPVWPNCLMNFWGDNFVLTDPAELISWGEQDSIARYWLALLIEKCKSLYGRRFDILVMDNTGAPDMLNPTIRGDSLRQCFAWHENMRIVDGLPSQPTSSQGVTPYYIGASVCTHETTKPPDTFTNTGNEIILIKDGGVASTHDITVTSSLDPLINSPYTLALSPDRGTFIGPYSLDEYGALPTITYDNTNLYVSVLKVEASA